MRKDLLLSLLAAGVTPLGALANVNVNDQIPAGKDWQISGFEGQDFSTASWNPTAGEISLNQATAGYLETTITNLLPGKTYVLGFQATNAVVKVNGVEVANGGTFTLGEDRTTAVIRVSHENTEAFAIGKFSLYIKFDNAKAKAELVDLMPEVPQVDPKDDSEEAEALKAYYNENLKDLEETINTNLGKLDGTDMAYADYVALDLENYPEGDVITGEINELKDALTEDYTTRVAAENALYANVAANIATLDSIELGKIVSVDWMLTHTTEKDGPLTKSLLPTVENLKGESNRIKGEIDTLKANREALEATPEEFKASEAYTTIKDDAASFQTTVTALALVFHNYQDIQDKAWKQIWDNPTAPEGATTMANLEKQYTEVLNYLMGLRDSQIAPEKAGYFADQIVNLKNIYDTAVADVNAKIPEDATSAIPEDGPAVNKPNFKAELNSVISIISTAQTAMYNLKADVDQEIQDYTNQINASNAAKAAADAALGTLRTNLNDITIDAKKVGEVEGANMYQNLTGDKTAIQEKIDAIQTRIDEAAKTFTATWTTQGDDSDVKAVEAIQDEIDALAGYVTDAEQAYNKYSAAQAAITNQLQSPLDEAKSDLIDEQDEAPQTKYNVVAATDGAYKALKQDIAEFRDTAAESYKEYAEGYKDGKTAADVQTLDTSSPVYTYIAGGINNYKTLGSQLIQDFKTADTTVAGLEDINLGDTDNGWIHDWSEKAMEGNTELKGALEAINGVKTSTSEKITGLRDSIEAAYNLRPYGQKMLTAIEAFLATIDSEKANIETTVAYAKADFMKAIETGNLEVVKTLYTNVNDTWINPDTEKKPVIGDAHWGIVAGVAHGIYDALYGNNDATIPGKLNKAPTATDKETAYTSIDTELNNLVSQLNQINSDCEKYKVNEDVNRALQTLIANAQANINSASTTVDKTYDPAKTTLQGLVAAEQKDLDLTSEAIKDQYKNTDINKLLTTDDQTAYETMINNVAQKATDIESYALTNENNHNKLLEIATNTATKVKAALTQAQSLTRSEAVEAAIKTINAEMDKLDPLNNDVYDAYEAIDLCGENDETAELKARYDAIEAAVAQALTNAQTDYQNAVKKANWKVFADTFQKFYDTLTEETDNAFEAYKEYNANTNAKYKEGVDQFIKPYYEKISEYRNAEGKGFNATLYNDAYKYVADLLLNIEPGDEDWNKDDVTIITPETPAFKAFCDEAKEYTKNISEAIDDMKTAANDYAAEYFNNIYDPAKALVDNAETEMRAAMTNTEIADPIIDKLIGDFQGDLERAKSMKENYEAEGLALSPRMDGILDILEKYTPEEVKLRTEAAGNTYWIKVYGNAKTKMDEAKAEIDKLENLTEAQKQGYKDTIEGKKTAAGILNIEEAGDYARYELLKNLKDLNYRLDAVLTEVNTEVANAQAADKLVVDNRVAYNKWLGVVEDLNDAYIEMAGWVGALGLPAEEINSLHITGIKSNIDRFEKNIKAHEKDVLSQEELYTAIQSKIEGDIKAMYYTAYRDELEFLQGRLQDVAEALTNLKLENPNLENYDEWNNRISDLAEEISNDLEAAKPADDYTATAVVDKLKGYEEAINALGEEIAGDDWKPVTGNTDAIVEALNNKYNDIKADIQAEQTVLAGCEQSVQDEYKDALDTLALNLDGLKEQIDNLGTSIIALQGTYTDAMDEIATELETITNDIRVADSAAKAEAQKQAASNAAYDTLNAELAALRTQLNNAQQTVEGYKTIDQEAYAPMISNVQNLIDAAQTELDADKADYALTAESTLPNKAQIETGIKTLLETATDAETTHQIATANAALKEAADFIAAGKFLNKEKLDSRLTELKDAANTLVATDDAELAPGVIATAKLIAEQAEALLADAKENKVVVGDLNGNDILNATDLQDLMNLILSDGELDDMTKARADVNGDGTISAADIVALVDLVMGRSEAQVRINASRPAQAGENSISIYNVGSENGVTRYAICLNNAATFVNGQMDINLPAGMEIVNEAVAERASSLELMSRDHANGTHRILLASFEINEIADNQGALIYIDVEGVGNFTVDNVIFADANARAYALDGTSSDTTALQTITNGLKNLGDKIYNASGVMMDKIQKGINIIRKSDGSTQKTIGK